MEDGFYKLEGDMLLFAPNFVKAPTFELVRADKALYTYPQEGWFWYDTEAEARTAFGLPPAESE